MLGHKILNLENLVVNVKTVKNIRCFKMWQIISLSISNVSLSISQQMIGSGQRILGGIYRGADKSLARPGRKEAKVSVRMACISFGALPWRAGNLMTSRVSILLKSRASLTCFLDCFLPGRAKDLSAPLVLTAAMSALILYDKQYFFTS